MLGRDSIINDLGGDPENGFSIIVLNRNGGRHLQKLFESYSVHNSHKIFEFIVVDHASTDNSLDILRDFGQEFEIRVIEENTNKSFSYSNNNAVSQSRYENLLFVNNDIIIKKDVVPQILRHLKNDAVGIVGIDLYYPGEGQGRGALQHAGIRFKEDLRYQFFRPFNVKHPGTEKVENVPAVTGAFFACRKKDFIKAGQFFDSYFYGYEDVDLCLSIKKITGKKCIIDHNLFAIHDESATQKKDARRDIQKRRQNNIKTLISRYGYGLKRANFQDIYMAMAFWSEIRPVVGFAIADDASETAGDHIAIRRFAESVRHKFGYECRFLARKQKEYDWYSVNGLDVLVVMVDTYDLTKIRNAKPSLIKMAWMGNRAEEWASKGWFGGYDVYLCSSNKSSEYVREMAGYEAHILGMIPEQFGPILRDYRREKYRISIKIGIPNNKVISQWGDYYYALGLQKQFKRLGHSVRIDILPEWYRSESFGDDVVIVLRGFSKYKPSGSHINLMWSISHLEKISFDEYEGYDHVFSVSENHAHKLKSKLSVQVSALLQCTEFEDHILTYGGFIASLKYKLAGVKAIKKTEDPVRWAEIVGKQSRVFADRAGEILKIVKECDTKKSII